MTVVELLGIGLIAIAAVVIIGEQSIWKRPQPVPALIVSDEQRRRAEERLFATHERDERDRL